MRIKKPGEEEKVGFSMTPLIDVVFQLIIFFMLATEFTQHELEDVVLPMASEAIEDVAAEENRLMINIYHDHYEYPACAKEMYEFDRRTGENILVRPCLNEEHWKIGIKGDEVSLATLEQALIVEGNQDRERTLPDGTPDPNSLSNRAIQIRSDGAAPYRVVQKVFEACARAKIWKIEIGATKPAE